MLPEEPLVPGVENVAVFKILKNSARNCSDMRSLMGVSFTSEKSMFHQPGPVNVFRPRLPGAICTAVPFEITVGVEKKPSLTPLLTLTAFENICGPLRV